MSFMLTAISVSYTIKIQLKVMASTKQTSSSSHQKETCSCQDIVDKLTPCQDIADKLTPCQDIADKLTPCQDIADKLTPCQDIADKLTPCQDIADKLTPLTLNITHSHKVTTISSLIS
jgi:hypothetical protein